MNSFGSKIRVTIFGESHGPAIGCVLEGLPAGESIDFEALKAFLERRAPGRNALSTSRKESDAPEFLSGVLDGVLTGAPVCAVIRNADHHSGDYAQLKDLPRPGHADYPAAIKFHGFNDVRGGGIFSGRLTAPLCVAGGILLQLLERRGIVIGAQIQRIHKSAGVAFDPVTVSAGLLRHLNGMEFPVLEESRGAAMREEILSASAQGDSVGGVVECAVTGFPAGVGDPMFNGLENRLAQALFAIPAVKGVEFGAGFQATELYGSENNDPFVMKGDTICTETNRCGGILGGISTGMPLVFRAAFKPTPSIAKSQQTVSLSRREEAELVIQGRHDPCVVLRAVPVVMAATALALYDALP